MSNSTPSPSPLSNESVPPAGTDGDHQAESATNSARNVLKGSTQFLCFWTAVALPFVYLPLLAQGLGDPRATLIFLGLLGINILTLYIGHDYKRR
ncbi:hypothetical protein [Natrialba chahannaoensis]|uniref:hypothetical protein n=1 Tax=Natrialba chahannaoensis TaxID=68911 RepID=UPI000677676F|nr:hypothetical protein [Natrialba chahannaoensis]